MATSADVLHAYLTKGWPFGPKQPKAAPNEARASMGSPQPTGPGTPWPNLFHEHVSMPSSVGKTKSGKKLYLPDGVTPTGRAKVSVDTEHFTDADHKEAAGKYMKMGHHADSPEEAAHHFAMAAHHAGALAAKAQAHATANPTPMPSMPGMTPYKPPKAPKAAKVPKPPPIG